MQRKILTALGLLALIGLGVFFSLPSMLDKRMNGLSLAPPYNANAQALALHRRLFIADLHDDALLWSRDLLTRHDYGHSDFPRLQEGRVSLQVFSTVTKTPRGLNFERNAADTDNITMLVMAQRWPQRTWGSLLQRALYQGEKLHKAAAGSGGRMQVVRTRADLAAMFRDAAPAGGRLAAVLATEGLHPLEGKLENVDRLFDAGFRMAGLTHFFDNEVGGSAHGLDKGGLTPFGKQVVRRLEDRKMIVDLAHASPKVIDDVLAMAQRPLLVSHTGVQGTCPGPRNLSDAHIKGIAATGGVIGIGYFEGAVCGLDAVAIIKAIRHAVDIAGVKHVALGSDFDGATRVAFDTTGLVLLTQGLLESGFSEADVADIMGGNVLRLLATQLP
ncbi:MAG: peptidase M19 [Betaproteobacteria bacterium HGW-Betaproteobacteria-3]|jgi:microsomal dipeptidase-like Zn-dependent dipeptidase|nr:MAG: peptidase M19 [Betaproteobacteria bacterium HGW-Betaproteobacteria-3]